MPWMKINNRPQKEVRNRRWEYIAHYDTCSSFKTLYDYIKRLKKKKKTPTQSFSSIQPGNFSTSKWLLSVIFDQLKSSWVLRRSGINQMSFLFPLSSISCTRVWTQSDPYKPIGAELYLARRGKKKVTYFAPMLSRSGYKYTIKAREKAKVFSGICIFHWLELSFSGCKHRGPNKRPIVGALRKHAFAEEFLNQL